MRFESTIEEPEHISDAALANRRLFSGIVVSLLVHAIVLSLQFGIPGLDFPSLEAPWKEKRTAMDALQVQIASPAPKVLPVPPTPAVTKPELFKLPTPILPAPVPKAVTDAITDSKPKASAKQETKGIQLIAPLVQAPTPVAEAKPQKKSKSKPSSPPPPSVKRVPPPAQAPTRIIAQDLVVHDDFVVPLTSEEDLLRQAEDKKEVKQKIEAIPEDAIIDKNAELELLAEEKRQEEIKQKKIQQEKIAQDSIAKASAEKARAEQDRAEKARLRAEQKIQEELTQKTLAQAAEEKLKAQMEQQMQQQAAEIKRQQAEQLAQQRLLAQREQAAAEEALREAKRQELLTQETLKQEEQRRQAEQKRLRQLALEQEQQKQEALAQAQLRQKQLEEQAEQRRALEIAERQRQQAEAQRIEVQRQAQIAEQKLAEQKALEQKIQEQRLAEQRAAEQKVLEQRLAEQKLAEQRLAEQRLGEQRAAEQRAQAEAAARANAEREAAIAARQNAVGNNRDLQGQGRGGNGIEQTGKGLAYGTGQGDLASRLREQARNSDLFKSAPSNGKLLDENRSRRRSFLGAYDKEVPLRMYVDGLKQKLERNGNLIHERRTLSDVEHNVLVNMVVRSDGSIEEVVIVRSSGLRSIDEKARNIIMTNAPFAAFPPGLAAKYDVIEIQRVWSFGDKLRILENLPSAF
ncbi:energy transducer TonB [Undibacterium baiyunense]|uniref:TonB C-terminal domain-containing protein n=1 Tax=Undibacterium baiyunense TaxID=2828731 RepID=A0A941DF87_9BURK|nr:energy transducer TonB [Undibacterium baiyunense]MBR7746881.1 hypothetical protein [Undibacterium baiyunense]